MRATDAPIAGGRSAGALCRRLAPFGLIVLAAFALTFTGCGEATGSDANPAERAYPYTVVTTTGMIADIAARVAGDKAEVGSIMQTGVDPHLYNPSRRDVIRLRDADVVFYNGLMLEGRMSDVLVRVARTGRPVHAVTEMIDDEDYVMTDEADYLDPHVWMDVSGWMMAVEAVARALGEYDPAHADEYHANAAEYLSELERLDDYARRVIASIPERQRVLVTAHDAFGYLGRAYGIEVRGIQGMSTESEAGLRDINELIGFLVERDLRAVFVESTIADRNVRALVEGAASRGHRVEIGGELFSDAMGPFGTYEGTYIGMIDHNVTTIARALGGDAPERGMNGRLGR